MDLFLLLWIGLSFLGITVHACGVWRTSQGVRAATYFSASLRVRHQALSLLRGELLSLIVMTLFLCVGLTAVVYPEDRPRLLQSYIALYLFLAVVCLSAQGFCAWWDELEEVKGAYEDSATAGPVSYPSSDSSSK